MVFNRPLSSNKFFIKRDAVLMYAYTLRSAQKDQINFIKYNEINPSFQEIFFHQDY